MANFDEVELYHMVPPVKIQFVKQMVTIGSQEMSIEQWVKIRDRIDVNLRRKNLIPAARSKSDPNHTIAGQFLQNNLNFVNRKLKRGFLKRPPFFLRPFYDAVVTKEQYD